MDLESPGSDLLHRPHLIEHVLERRQVILQPGIASLGIPLDRPGHPRGSRRNGPAGDWNKSPLTRSEELVNRDSRGLSHEVVHRHAEGQTGLVANPVEGIRPFVLADHIRVLGECPSPKPIRSELVRTT